jgi:ABC-type branched-subunit amino acid transport system ATPase component
MTTATARVLEVTGLSKAFGSNLVVDNVSLTVEDGRVTSLIGPNGAGKTTLFNLLTGFLPPDSGEVRYLGARIRQGAPHTIVGLGVARTFQELRLFPSLSAIDNITIAVGGQPGERLVPLVFQWRTVRDFEQKAKARALELLDFVGLNGYADVSPEQMSYGQQKRLALARVLATDAAVICLDEPAAGLDPEAIGMIVGLVRQIADAGRAVFVIEHNLEIVREFSDYVIFMNLGRIEVEGPTDVVLDDPRVLQGFLGL